MFVVWRLESIIVIVIIFHCTYVTPFHMESITIHMSHVLNSISFPHQIRLFFRSSPGEDMQNITYDGQYYLIIKQGDWDEISSVIDQVWKNVGTISQLLSGELLYKLCCKLVYQPPQTSNSLDSLWGYIASSDTSPTIFLLIISRCYKNKQIMMTSSIGRIFRITGHLCGEFTGPRWIPRTKASEAELWYFLWSASE